MSEEAWWLKRASSRGRCRLLKELADAFQLKVAHVQDIHSHDSCSVAVPTMETLVHDIGTSGNTVSVFNECADTTRPFNGMLTRMHPGEGFWLFKGSRRGATFGSTFGDARRCGVFPVTQPPTFSGEGVQVCQSDPCVVYGSRERPTAPKGYQCFDESFFKMLERADWDRNNGYVELMPIIVGVPGP